MSKKAIAEKLAKVLGVKQVECITIFGMKAKFGGGRTSAFALVYNDLEAKKKFDSMTSLRRVSFILQRKQKGSNFGH